MKCPKCQRRMRVIDSRHNPKGRYRRYRCGCGSRLSTYEILKSDYEVAAGVVDIVDQMVVKSGVLIAAWRDRKVMEALERLRGRSG